MARKMLIESSTNYAKGLGALKTQETLSVMKVYLVKLLRFLAALDLEYLLPSVLRNSSKSPCFQNLILNLRRLARVALEDKLMKFQIS